MESQAYPTGDTSIMNNTGDYCSSMPAGAMIWAIITGPCATVGIPASVWLLLTLIQRKGLTSDIYMFNLTVMDLICSSCILPYTLNFFIWQNNFISRMGNSMFSMNMNGRPLLMTCTCVDCYMAVAHPISYMKTKDSKWKATVCRLVCVLVWGLTIAIAIWFAVTPNIFSSPSIVIVLALTVPAIVVLDVAILRTLRKPDPSGKGSVHPQKQRALQTITNSLVMTLFSYLPSLVIYTFILLMPLTLQEKVCYILIPSSAISILASTIMPLLFLENLGKFRGLRLRWFGCPRVE